MSDDWEYSDSSCPKCYEQMAFRRCNECGGDGFVEEDDDLEWADNVDSCENCNGMGFEEWCRACGWDETFGRFMNPQYEQAFNEKQVQETNK